MCLILLQSMFAFGTQEQTTASETGEPGIAEVQILLGRAGFSAGEIDGVAGRNTRIALAVFQESNNLKPTGKINPETLELLNPEGIEVYTSYTILPEDVKGPFTSEIPEDFMEKAKLESLNYTSPLEALAEKFHCSPELLQKLNPEAAWNSGEEIQVPNVLDQGGPQTQASESKQQNSNKHVVIVDEKQSTLVVTNSANKIVFFAPVTAGSKEDPLPLGRWKVVSEVLNPTFYYNPELFWDADPSHSKAKLPPGPNNPVGTIWIEIDAEHYGIHGTPEPGQVGHTQSHGCVRLTNWDAEKLSQLIQTGTEVIFE